MMGQDVMGVSPESLLPLGRKGWGMTGMNRYLCKCVGWSFRIFSLLASNFVTKEAKPMKGKG